MNRIVQLSLLAAALLFANGCIAVGVGGKAERLERWLDRIDDRLSRLESHGPHHRPADPFGPPPPPMMSEPAPPPGAPDPFAQDSELRRRIEQLERENRELRGRTGGT